MARKDQSDTNINVGANTSDSLKEVECTDESGPLQEGGAYVLALKLWSVGRALAFVGFLSLILVLLASARSFEQTLFWLTIGLIGALFSPEGWLHAAFGNYHHGWGSFSLFLLIVGIGAMTLSSVLRLVFVGQMPPSRLTNDISHKDDSQPLPYSPACDEETTGNPS